MRILVATGIYPPEIGGPAQYARGIEEAFYHAGYIVTIKTFGKVEKVFPTGLRHAYFALKSLWVYIRADRIIVLDTWSVALPIALLTFIFRKKFIIRTGGDFLWESYIERTQKKVLLKDFYNREINNLNKKEKFIFKTTKWILKMANTIIFSTEWQKDIWEKPYDLEEREENKNSKIKINIVENYIGDRIDPQVPKGKYFIASTRSLVWKNTDMLQKVFEDKEVIDSGARIDGEKVDHDEFIRKIRKSYAVILVSLGDISPNMILDAVQCGKPFICTRECGLFEKLKDIGVWVDPLNKDDIKEKVLWLSNENNYQDQCIKVASFRETHSWNAIIKEILSLPQ